MIPSTSLSPIEPWTSVSGAGGVARRREERPEVVERRASAAAPAGLWAPSRSTSRPSTRSELEAARATRAPRSRAGARRRGTVAIPAVSSASSTASATAAFVGLVAAAERDPRRAERRQLDLDAVPIPAEERRRRDLGERRPDPPGPAPDHRQRLAGRARDGQVPALDDRRLLPRDRRDRVAEPGHVVEGDVRDRGDAAVPGVGRVEPPAEPDLDERRPRRRSSANHRKSIAVSSSNSVGGPWRRSTRSAAARTSPTSRANVTGSIGRPSISSRSRYDDEVRLGRRADADARRRAARCRRGRGRCPCRSSRRRARRAADAADRRSSRGGPVSDPAPAGPRTGPRSDSARTAAWYARVGPPAARPGSTAAQLLLVEHALVEARREAHVVDVALLEVHAAAQLAARDDAVLADDALEQVRARGSAGRRGSRSRRSAGRRSGAGSGRPKARVRAGSVPRRRPDRRSRSARSGGRPGCRARRTAVRRRRRLRRARAARSRRARSGRGRTVGAR